MTKRECENCNGFGQVVYRHDDEEGDYDQDCPECDGTGEVEEDAD